jgi:2-polyprenyl-3-methyl-5-hydroxy-6-metoxy-1,4-benzoquinol methylase
MRRRERCPLCTDSEGDLVLSLPYDSPEIVDFLTDRYGDADYETYLGGETLAIRHCASCKFYWHEFVLEDDGMETLYEDWCSRDERERLRAGKRLLKRNDWDTRETNIVRASRLRNYFEKRPKNVRALDFGMGWGEFLLAVQALGCEVVGVELSEMRREYASDNGVPVVPTLDAVEGQFDFVSVHQTLEHVPDPDTLVSQLADRVVPGGLLHVTVPNPESPTEENILANSPFQPLEHVNAFTRSALVNLVRDYGGEVVYPSPSLVKLRRLLEPQGLAKYLLYLTGTMKFIESRRRDTNVFFRLS